MFKQIFGSDPAADLEVYRDMLSKMVENGFVLPRDLRPAAVASIIMPVDILDAGPEIIILANLPGVKSENLSITLIEDVLHLRGKVQPHPDHRGATYIRRERRATNFSRSITLPENVDGNRAEVILQCGLLTITLPKSTPSQSQPVKVSLMAEDRPSC